MTKLLPPTREQCDGAEKFFVCLTYISAVDTSASHVLATRSGLQQLNGNAAATKPLLEIGKVCFHQFYNWREN
jgi:hypothetical protein